MAKHLCEAPLVVVKAAALWLIQATNVNHHVTVVQCGWVTAAHNVAVCNGFTSGGHEHQTKRWVGGLAVLYFWREGRLLIPNLNHTDGVATYATMFGCCELVEKLAADLLHDHLQTVLFASASSTQVPHRNETCQNVCRC